MSNELQLRFLCAVAWGIALGWATGYLTDSPAFGPALVATVLTLYTVWFAKRRKRTHKCEWCGGDHPTIEHRNG